MAKSDANEIVGRLPKRYGRTFAEELSIDTKRNEPSPVVSSSDQRVALQYAQVLAVWPSISGACDRPMIREMLAAGNLCTGAQKGECMAISVRTVEYFYTRVEKEPRTAYELLARLAAEDVCLLSALFHSVLATLS
jgi:hypothetical protein